MRKFYEVEAKCGHVGIKNCIWVKFAVCAENGKDAAAKARIKPRVKHSHKDAIRSVRSITFEEYYILKLQNIADPYLNCKNVQQQRAITDLKDRIEPDYFNIERREIAHNKTKCTEYKRRKFMLKCLSHYNESELDMAI